MYVDGKLRYEVCLVQNRTTQIKGKPCIVERGLENKISRTRYADDFDVSYEARASQLCNSLDPTPPVQNERCAKLRFLSCYCIKEL